MNLPHNTLEAFNEAFNRHDAAGMMAFMTADCVFENTAPSPDGTRLVGQAAVGRFWSEFFAANPAAQILIEEIIVFSPERAAQRWRYDWGAGHVRGIDLFRFENGLIAEKLSYVKG